MKNQDSPLEEIGHESVTEQPFASMTIGPRRRQIGWIVAVGAIISMIISGTYFQWIPLQPFEVPELGVLWMFIGAILLGIAIWLLKPVAPAFQIVTAKAESVSITWQWVALGTLGLLVLAEANANLVFKDFNISQHIQFFLLVAGPLAIAYGLGSFRQLSRKTVIQTLRSRSTVAVMLITALGLAIRVWHISSALHIMIDELHFYDAVVRLWQNETLKIITPVDGIAAFPFIFPYFQRWTVAIFGSDFAGMRMASAILGTLTIPALYLLAKELFNVRVALIAAALMAVFPAEIHFSRLALNNIADPLFGTLALAFLVRGLRRNSISDFALAGINLGFSSYFYEGGRLLFLALCVAWLGFIIITKRPWIQRRGLLIVAGSAVIVALPYYYTMSIGGGALTPRLNSEGIGLHSMLEDLKTKPLLDVLVNHYQLALQYTLFHTIYSPDSSQFYYGGYTGILEWFVVPFYFLGLFFALWRWRLIGALLWGWLAIGIIGISLIDTVDWTVRFCALFPAMMLAVAVGLYYPLEMIWPSKVDKRYLYGLLTLLVVVMGTAEVTYYFGPHLAVLNRQIRVNRRDFYSAFDLATQYPTPSKLYFLTDDGAYTPVMDTSLVFRHIDMVYEMWKKVDVTINKLEDLPKDETLSFALDPGDEQTLTTLRSVFKNLEGPIFSNYESVPRDQQYELYVYHPASRWRTDGN